MGAHRKSQEGFPLEPTSTMGSCLSAPEKVALSSTTTMSVDPDEPRTSKDSVLRSARCNPFETDIEANHHTISNTGSCPRKASDSDCRAWPGKDHWKQKAKEAKKKRSCALMASLSQRSRIILKILIAVLIIGIGVGVGFGVSKPLGAPIWGDHH